MTNLLTIAAKVFSNIFAAKMEKADFISISGLVFVEKADFISISGLVFVSHQFVT